MFAKAMMIGTTARSAAAAGPVLVTIELTGGGGGGGHGAGGNDIGGDSGRGKFSFLMEPGTELTLYVARGGQTGNGNGTAGVGGWGWGSGGAGGTQDDNQTGAGGAGSSAVLDALTNLLVAIAGGAGATSHSGNYNTVTDGGDVGDTTNVGGNSSKNGQSGEGQPGPTGKAGGGGGGSNSGTETGGTYNKGGRSYLNTSLYSATELTATIARAVGAQGNAAGGNGTIKITDNSGTTTYSYVSNATQTHIVS
jgi:hypothetical protein